ncbi:MAG: PKD domain-containing protein [Hellea sp.]
MLEIIAAYWGDLRVKIVTKSILFLSSALWLAACGGSSSGGGTPPPTPPPTSTNNPPSAKAGNDVSQDIAPGTIALDGSASSDPDGNSLTYNWAISSQPATANISLTGATTSQPSFTSSVPGDYTFTLTVRDPSGATHSDSVTVTLINQAPTLSVGSYKTNAAVGQEIVFDASGSTDPNGHMLNYTWTITQAPADSGMLSETFTDAVQSITFDTDGEFILEVSVSDGYESDSQTLNQLEIDLFEIIELSRKFTDAEFDQVNQRIIGISGREFTIVDSDGTETALTLPLDGAAVSIAPSGNFAAVAHNARISYIDLQAKTILATHSVTADLGDIVLDDNGYAHGFPSSGQWVNIQTVNMQTGSRRIGDGFVRDQTKAKLHPNGDKIYGANNGLSPSDVERYSINGATTRYDYDSPYHGNFPFCGDLWMGPGGTSMLTKCGVVVRTTENQSTDLTYVMQLPVSGIRQASSSDFTRSWYISLGGSVRVFDADNGEFMEEIDMPSTRRGASKDWWSEKAFASANSDSLHILASNSDSGTKTFALVKRYATATSASDFAPTAKTERFKSVYASNQVMLDASASSDPENKTLTYEWMLTSQPSGSAVTPTGLDSAAPRFTPSVAGTYEFSLRVSNGERQSQIERVSVNVFASGDDLVHRLEGGIADAEYSQSLNALVYLSDTENTLGIFDLDDFTTKTVLLDRTAYQLGISPNGNFAAISHAGVASLVDLNSATVIDTQSYSADWGDIVLDNNNHAHIVPWRDQWVELHSLDFAADRSFQVFGARAGTQIRMSPTEPAVYGANRGLSPSDIEKWDVSNLPVPRSVDSPYHGDYAMGGNIWIREDGNRLLVAAGNGFTADMTYDGALSDNASVKWADHSSEAGKWAVIPSGQEEEIRLYNEAVWTFASKLSVADIPASTPVTAKAEKVFYSEDGNTLNILIKGDGIIDAFAIQTR